MMEKKTALLCHFENSIVERAVQTSQLGAAVGVGGGVGKKISFKLLNCYLTEVQLLGEENLTFPF